MSCYNVPVAIEIIHDDAALVAVAKPSGMVVHRGEGTAREAAVLQLARDATGGAHLYPVHRLDRGTSGVLVLARSPEVARRLHGQLEDGAAEKRYLALVRGAPPAAGRIDHPIPRRVDGPRVPAVTDYRWRATVVIRVEAWGRDQPYALVDAWPRTGRLHQVRRHLKHLGHPVIGDVSHGRSEHNRLCRERFGLARLALHAAELAIDHPVTGERLHLAAPLPDDLRQPLERMGFAL